MFSANPSISPTGLKPLDVAKGRENGVGLEGTRSDLGERGRTRGKQGRTGGEWDRTGREQGRTREERGRTGGERGQTRGNGVGLGKNGIGLEGERGRTGGGTGSDWGNGVGLGARIGGVGQGYKRRGQLIWPHSLPLTAPKPLASN